MSFEDAFKIASQHLNLSARIIMKTAHIASCNSGMGSHSDQDLLVAIRLEDSSVQWLL
jgi:hypothetical protein